MNVPGSLPPERTRARSTDRPHPLEVTDATGRGRFFGVRSSDLPSGLEKSNGVGDRSPHGPSTVSVRETRAADAARL